MTKYASALTCALLAAVSASAAAQVRVMAVERPTVLSTGSTLPSNTEVWISLNQELTSKSIKQGQKFDVSVARDVMLGNYIVIPRGTPGHGQVSYRTGKGAFGKSAKMEFDLVDVVVGGSFVSLSGHYRIEGQGNTGATVGAVVVAPILGAFVTGRSAVASQGTEWKGFTREPLFVQVAALQGASPEAAAASPAPTSQGAMIAPAAVSAGPGRRALTPYELGRLQGQQALARAAPN